MQDLPENHFWVSGASWVNINNSAILRQLRFTKQAFWFVPNDDPISWELCHFLSFLLAVLRELRFTERTFWFVPNDPIPWELRYFLSFLLAVLRELRFTEQGFLYVPNDSIPWELRYFLTFLLFQNFKILKKIPVASATLKALI